MSSLAAPPFAVPFSSGPAAAATADAADDADGANPKPDWRTMLDVSMARSRKVRGGNYVQLATATSEGEPRVRTVVQRGLLAHGGHATVFKFITDARSEKVAQLRHRADAEMCWWFLKSSEQYRVRGKLTVVGNGEDEEEDAALLAVRKQQWGNLRDAAREQFYWTQPGVPLSEEGGAAERAGAGGQGGGCEETAGIPAGGRGQDGKVLPPPPTFLLLLLWPTCIDYLRLTDNCRMVFEQDSGGATWKGKEVSP
jgi:pyridoxamine 5'-phosphate oxidase